MEELERKIKKASESWKGVDVDKFMDDVRGRDRRGGARPGAGRKAADPEDKRVQMVITIDRDTREKLKAISRARKMRVGRLIDEIVKGEW